MLTPIASLVAAGVVSSGFCSPVFVPPPRFDHTPVDSFAAVPVGPDEIFSWCGIDPALVRDGRIGACTVRAIDGDPVSWWIYFDRTLPRDQFQCVMRHEEGHVNGWLHDRAHPLDSTSTEDEG